MTDTKSDGSAKKPFTHRELLGLDRQEPSNHRRKEGKASLYRLAIGYLLTTSLLIWTGPFGTYDLFPFIIHTLYWGLINLAAWFLTASFAIGIEAFLKRNFQPLSKHLEVAGAFVAGCLSALPLAFIVIMANNLALPYSNNPQAISRLPNFLSLLSHIAPLTVLISVLYTLWHHRQSSEGEAALNAAPPTTQSEEPDTTISPFFDRLPNHLGKDLLWLSSQDHYLEVKTSLGKDLILMRLIDAVKELESYPGARIHRSHWVADKAISRIEILDGRQVAHLNDETCLPISRTYRQVPSQRGWPTSRK